MNYSLRSRSFTESLWSRIFSRNMAGGGGGPRNFPGGLNPWESKRMKEKKTREEQVSMARTRSEVRSKLCGNSNSVDKKANLNQSHAPMSMAEHRRSRLTRRENGKFGSNSITSSSNETSSDAKFDTLSPKVKSLSYDNEVRSNLVKLRKNEEDSMEEIEFEEYESNPFIFQQQDLAISRYLDELVWNKIYEDFLVSRNKRPWLRMFDEHCQAIDDMLLEHRARNLEVEKSDEWSTFTRGRYVDSVHSSSDYPLEIPRPFAPKFIVKNSTVHNRIFDRSSMMSSSPDQDFKSAGDNIKNLIHNRIFDRLFDELCQEFDDMRLEHRAQDLEVEKSDERSTFTRGRYGLDSVHSSSDYPIDIPSPFAPKSAGDNVKNSTVHNPIFDRSSMMSSSPDQDFELHDLLPLEPIPAPPELEVDESMAKSDTTIEETGRGLNHVCSFS